MQTTKLIFLVIPLALSGCAVPIMVSMGVGATSVAVNETTGKTVTDHTVSAINGQDCRIGRLGKENVCQDEIPQTKLKITTTGVVPSSVEEIQSRYR